MEELREEFAKKGEGQGAGHERECGKVGKAGAFLNSSAAGVLLTMNWVWSAVGGVGGVPGSKGLSEVIWKMREVEGKVATEVRRVYDDLGSRLGAKVDTTQMQEYVASITAMFDRLSGSMVRGARGEGHCTECAASTPLAHNSTLTPAPVQAADMAREMDEHARRVNAELREAERRMETRLRETRAIGDRLTEHLEVSRDQVGRLRGSLRCREGVTQAGTHPLARMLPLDTNAHGSARSTTRLSTRRRLPSTVWRTCVRRWTRRWRVRRPGWRRCSAKCAP